MPAIGYNYSPFDMKKVLILIFAAALAGCTSFHTSPGTKPADQPPAKQVAFVIDDLPGVVFGLREASDKTGLNSLQMMNNRMVKAFNSYDVPAAGFVIEKQVSILKSETDKRTALLELWLKKGLILGNHTFSHLDFNRTPVATFKTEILNGEKHTVPLLAKYGQKQKYFRFPYNQTGPNDAARNEIKAFLATNGYVIVPYSLGNYDYVYDEVYKTALDNGDKELAKSTLKEYLDCTARMIDFVEPACLKYVGHPVKHIFMMHLNDINAECMTDILDMLKDRGYSFITIDEAMTDDAYVPHKELDGLTPIGWLRKNTQNTVPRPSEKTSNLCRIKGKKFAKNN